MADIAVTVQQAGRAAVSTANYTDDKTAATSGNNYLIPNDGKVGVILECTGGGTATVLTPNAVDGLAITDLALTLTAAKIKLWGGFPPKHYNNSSEQLSISVSANTNLLAFRLA
jgi:hypothetical protein